MHFGLRSAHRSVHGAPADSFATAVDAILVYLVAAKRRLSIIALLLVLLGAEPPAWPASPEAQLALAKSAYKQQDYAGALKAFRDAAESGEPAAMAGLGGLYA